MKLEDIQVTVDKPVTMSVAEYYAKVVNDHPGKVAWYERTIREALELNNLEPIGMFNRDGIGDMTFIGFSGQIVEPTGGNNPFESGMRLAVKPKAPKYRYVTDGVMRQGKDGEFCFDYGLLQFKTYESITYKQTSGLWHTREEVK